MASQLPDACHLIRRTLSTDIDPARDLVGLGPIHRIGSVSRATDALPVAGLACTSRRGKNNKPSCAVLAGLLWQPEKNKKEAKKTSIMNVVVVFNLLDLCIARLVVVPGTCR